MRETYVLGVDMGGTKTNIALCNAAGELSRLRRFEYEQSSHKQVIKEIIHSIRVYLDETAAGADIAAIGLGLKGHVLNTTGVWDRCITIPGFRAVALGEMIQSRFGIPTFLDNDVHAATLAEKRYGVGKKYDNFIYYNIGTGLSIGIVSDGKLLRGATNYSGEIGHMVTESDGAPCPCGHFGCLEEASSGGAIIRQAREGLAHDPDSILKDFPEKLLTSAAVFDAARQGDALARKVSERALRSICLSMVAIINIFNPSAIVFGGGVMRDGYLLPAIRDYAWKYPLRPAAEAVQEIGISEIGPNIVGALGACCVAMEGIQEQSRMREE